MCDDPYGRDALVCRHPGVRVLALHVLGLIEAIGLVREALQP